MGANQIDQLQTVESLGQFVKFQNLQKRRRGLQRVWFATGYSFMGLRAAWNETAFRQEFIAALFLIPAAFWLGQAWVETALLVGSVIFVLVVEIINTAIEATVDRIGAEHNVLSKVAKDLGSAAVLLSLIFAIGVWAAFLYHRF